MLAVLGCIGVGAFHSFKLCFQLALNSFNCPCTKSIPNKDKPDLVEGLEAFRDKFNAFVEEFKVVMLGQLAGGGAPLGPLDLRT